MLLGLLRENPAKNDQVVVSLLGDCDLTAEARAAGATVYELGLTRNPLTAFGLLRLVQLIRRERPDVIQGWMYHGDLAALLALYLSGRRRRTALFWGIRCSDMDLDRYSRTLRIVVRLCAWFSRLPDTVIANAEAGRAAHKALGYQPSRFEVVHNGIDVTRFAPDISDRKALRGEFGIPDNVRVLAHVARVDPLKNHSGLLAALAQVSDLWLVLIGKDTDTLPRQDRVVALGKCSDVARVLPVADGIVSPSLFGEGFSNALAEGMACGLVPIATDVGDSRLLAAETGYVVPPNDQAALVQSLTEFAALSDDDVAAAGGASRDRIVAHFGITVAALKFQELHHAELERRRVPPHGSASK